MKNKNFKVPKMRQERDEKPLKKKRDEQKALREVKHSSGQ